MHLEKASDSLLEVVIFFFFFPQKQMLGMVIGISCFWGLFVVVVWFFIKKNPHTIALNITSISVLQVVN